jgi:hypothetical protein
MAWWYVAVFVVSLIISYAINPKPPKTKPPGINEVEAPTAEEGKEIPVLFGTKYLRGPNIVWYGNVVRTSFDTGWKYTLGIHMVMCHGPIDSIRSIEVGKKTAWRGYIKSGSISINKPTLFGGNDGEGGVVGDLDIEMGESDQTVNSYLSEALEKADIPAFRGVVGAVLKDVYVGNTAYIKNWAFRAQRVHTAQGGATQWYDGKAPITIFDTPLQLYLALDFSGSMDTITDNGETRYENMKTAVFAVLDVIGSAVEVPGTPPIDIMLVGYGTSPSTNMEITKRDVDIDDIALLKAWFPATSPMLYTYFPLGFKNVLAFFEGQDVDEYARYSFFFTDGGPSQGDPAEVAQAAQDLLFAVPGVKAYAFNIDLSDTTYTAYLDNTPEDGVPVLSGGESDEATNIILDIIGSHTDMNPVHIIRECLTNQVFGMGYTDADIDSTSFEAAADTLYDERMGMSLVWDKEIVINEFIDEIIRHIDAALYVSRETGKFVIKLIRADYDEETLVELDSTNISSLTDFSRPATGDLVNSVTVNYWDWKTDKNASLTVQDQALIQTQGGTVNTTVEYPGFSNLAVASNVASRDLKALSTPLIHGRLETNQVAKEFNIGDVFKLTWPEYDVSELPARITAISFGDGVNNTIRISFVQDKFDYALIGALEEEIEKWEKADTTPNPVEYQLTQESTYWEMAFILTGAFASDELLSIDSDVGFVTVAAARPDNATSATMWTSINGLGYDPYNKWALSGAPKIDFCPSGFLTADLDYEDTTIVLDNTDMLSDVVLGTLCQIGDEICRVDSVDTTTGTVTIGRSVLDSLPVNTHAAGDIMFFWQRYAEWETVDGTYSTIGGWRTWLHSNGDVVCVKVRVSTAEEEATLEETTAECATMDNRAIRPLPPGYIQINSEFYPEGVVVDDTTVTWSHRNRLFLDDFYTFYDFYDSTDYGPEEGTTYEIVFYDEDDNIASLETGITGKESTYLVSEEKTYLNKYSEPGDGIFTTIVPGSVETLKAHYPSSGLSGTTLADDTGNGHTATATNVTAETGNTGLIFTGATNSHVEFPYDVYDGLTEFAFSTWVNLDTVTTHASLLNIANASTMKELFFGITTKCFLYHGDNLYWSGEGPDIPLNAKTHIVLVRRVVV